MLSLLARLFRNDQLRKEIEQRTQELRDSEARLRGIFDTAADCIVTLDGDFNIQSVNAAGESLFGLPPEKMVGRPFSEFMMGGPVSWNTQVGTGEGRIFGMGGDVVGVRGDGTRFPASLSMSKVTVGLGRHYTAIVHDLTKFKKTEEALRQSETRLRLMLAQVPAILCTTDRKLRVTLFTSSAATGLTGLGGHSRRFLGDSLIDPDDPALEFLPAQAFYRALQGESVSTEVNWQERVFQFHIQALRDARNQIQGTIGIGLDVTQRKRTEAALQFYAQELQHRNAELVRSNQELDEFAYVASHDLKEPLRGIHNYVSFLIEDYGARFDQEGKEKLDRLQYLTNHMANLIDSLLEYSRVGRLDLAVRSTDLNEVVAEVLDSIGINLKQRGVEVRVPRPLPEIRCDQVRIGEAFRNLITNAMKYNDKDKKWIEIGQVELGQLPESLRAGFQDHARPAPIFYVRDNGIGIPAKHWNAVFRIFKRLHGRDKYGGGTGAGLTIVKKIIERHGGTIGLDSTEGVGTTFYFSIPEVEPPTTPVPVP